MNMHIPQSVLTETELKHLAATPLQIVGPGSNKPLIGIFQDSLLGSFQFSRSNIQFTPLQAMDLLASYPHVDVNELEKTYKEKGHITNFDIISQIMPPISLKYKTSLYDEEEDAKTSNHVLEIKNGKYIRGQLDKGCYESATKGILHRICNDYGNMACADFNDNMQAIITEYMKTCSYSVGISDLIANAETNARITDKIQEQKMQVQTLIDKIHLGIFENNTANSNLDHFELMVSNILNKATEEAGKIGKKSLNEDNRFLKIVNSGSKGSLINISQMLSCLGQTAVDGKRIPYGFEDRTLPHFKKFDDSPFSRGFIENSYITGLTAPELFFHAMAGRIGLIDTAVKSVTRETTVLVIEGDRPVYTQIGDWIDHILETATEGSVKVYPEDRNMELLDVDSIWIPTTDAHGVVTWGAVTAVTRHDPGNRLYKVTTRSGRTVTVPESKSLLIWDEERGVFEERMTPEIKLGDFVPVSKSLTEPPQTLLKHPTHNIDYDYESGVFIGFGMSGCRFRDNIVEFDLIDNWSHLRDWMVPFINDFCMNRNISYKVDYDSRLLSVKCEIYHDILLNLMMNPDHLFVANTEFIKGMLCGMFSMNGLVGSNRINYVCGCKSTAELLVTLCNRIGIFASMREITENNGDISAYHVAIVEDEMFEFMETIDFERNLLNPHVKHDIYEFIKIENGKFVRKFTEKAPKYKTVNNVVLDPIVTIEEVDVSAHPKLYDLTVPSTKNFGLANGLHVYDTSQTGYIQRRLVKGLEDLLVKYDMTVRNNKDKIIQFCYGEDNFDSMKVENQSLPIIEMSAEDIYMHYDIPGLSTASSTADMNLLQSIMSKPTVTRFKKQIPKLKEKVHAYIQNLTKQQEDIIIGVFKRQRESGVRMPVAFQYLIGNIQGQLELTENSAVDITPLEAFELIEEYFAKINSIKYAIANPLFEILYFYYLNPRDLLFKRRFHQKGLVLLLETILLKYKEALIHPGEMVGVVAAQSIGQEQTQLTLNSVTYETEILVRDQDGIMKKVQIGEFIEDGIARSKRVEYMEDKDTTYAELENYYEVPSASENGNTVWRRIEAVTRHPVINEDGTNTMLKITTKGSREVIVTKAKSLLQLVDGKIQQVEGSSVKVGDYLPVSKLSIGFAMDSMDVIPNMVNGKVVMEPRDGRMTDLEFDPIVSIEEVPNTTAYAYDLTVEDTRNFDIYNGLCLRDTFHSSGVSSKSNVTRGVPRIEEILRLTKNPKNPSMTVYLKSYDQEKQENAIKVASFMKHTKLVDVVKSVQICFDPIEDSTQIEEDRETLAEFYGFERVLQKCISGDLANCADEDARTYHVGEDQSKWIIRMEMDQDTLLENNITMDDIHFAITHSDYGANVHCVFTDYNADKLVFRIRTNTAIFQKATQKGYANPLDQSDKIYILKNFQDTLMNNIVLRGINHIQNVLPRKMQNSVVKEDAKYVKREIWVLDTTGSNLMETLALDFIDYKRTYSNDIKEVFDVLGIEAARQIIHSEMVEVMEFSGASVNYHHTSLLCDRMTCSKDMVSIFRSGLLNDNVGPIAKATFEVHTEVFLNAARHGEFDHMRGVSANIMCGQQGLYGTNAFQILLDMKAMESVVAPQHETRDVEAEIERAFDKKKEEGDKCGTSIEIQNNIVNVKRTAIDVTECFDDKYDMGF